MNEAAESVITLTKKDKARFWAKVDKSAGPDGCWLWTACKFHDGYGQFHGAKRTLKSHRVAWMLANGQIKRGICVCHRCDNPACCNPAHLFLGTHMANMIDRDLKQRGNPRVGVLNGRAKLTESDVLYMRKAYHLGDESIASLAKKYHMGTTAIKYTLNGRAWKHLPVQYSDIPD